MAIDPPWRLDPLKKIVEVGWRSGADILMLHFMVNTHVHEPHPVSVQPFRLDQIANAFDNPIHQHDNHVPTPVIADPLGSDMLAHSYVWNRVPVKPSLGVDLMYAWRAVLFFNLAKIKTLETIVRPEAYDIVVSLPASEKKTETGIGLYAFTTFGLVNDWEAAKASAPHPISDVRFELDGPHTLVGNILVFGNEAERSTFLSLNGDWFTHNEPLSGDTFDLLDWEIKGYTYRKRKTFPLNDSLDPTYPADEKQIDFQVQHEHATVAVQIPARTVTFTVNLKTLALTSTKV
jgi:hypothetical protein